MTNPFARPALAAALLTVLSFTAQAQQTKVLVEDFEADFPAWESGWFKQNSNAMNAFCQYAGVYAGIDCNFRGIPDGMLLWTADAVPNQPLTLRFNETFGKSIQNLEFDIAAVYKDPISVYDSSGQLIFSQIMNPTAGYFADPGIYEHFAIASTNGISRIEWGGKSTNNFSIDNIAATVTVSAVPEPGTWAMLAVGGLAVVGLARRRQVPASA